VKGATATLGAPDVQLSIDLAVEVALVMDAVESRSRVLTSVLEKHTGARRDRGYRNAARSLERAAAELEEIAKRARLAVVN
jgi:phosphate uptake regulator